MMYRKDYFLNETQRLAQLIAKLLGLKNDENHQEYQQLYSHALNEEYDITEENLIGLTHDDFKAWLAQQKFSAVKLDALAQLLYHSAKPFQTDNITFSKLHKIIILFDLLETEHHLLLFENISKRKTVQQYIQQHDA